MNRHTVARGLACVVLLGFVTVTTVTAPAAEAKCPHSWTVHTGTKCTPRDT